MKHFKFKEIILVDDDEVVALLIKKMLNKINFEGEVSFLKNGLEALNIIEARISKDIQGPEYGPCLILLDLNMPIMDGWGLMESLKEYPNSVMEVFKIAIVTNSYNPSDQLKALEYPNILGYINKPLSPEIFLDFLIKEDLYEE
ncbi:response regulator [Algoriphagus persicinus]|uniref:response regulator n=1 Tax=Algoriphagus persicinus TaxID=3108754 RepID=UPI002B3C45C6|nr:response regulator [Algoriphagus sp. E1-3-M2]MEB2787357.1 response regulator [Algoriphagus sp. E1-3-M2]